MKRLLLLLLTLALLCCSSGCRRKTATEPANAAPTDDPTQTVDEQPVAELPADADYTITAIDRSLTNRDGDTVIIRRYDLFQFTGDTPAMSKINTFLQTDCENFFMDPSPSALETLLQEATPDLPYRSSQEYRVSFRNDRYLCLCGSFSWFMGGTGAYGTDAYTFDLATGEEALLTALTGMDGATLEKTLHEVCLPKLKAHYGDDFGLGDVQEATDRFNATKWSEFHFCIQENEICLIFSKYEYASGASGPCVIPTGLKVVGA